MRPNTGTVAEQLPQPERDHRDQHLQDEKRQA